MVDEAVTLPEPRPEDDEDVVWGLSTAAALWARGERGDAVVWLRRAADAATAAGQAARAAELGMVAVRVEQAMEQLIRATMPPPRPPVSVEDAPFEERLSIQDLEILPISSPPLLSGVPQPRAGTIRPPPGPASTSRFPPPMAPSTRSGSSVPPPPASLASPPVPVFAPMAPQPAPTASRPPSIAPPAPSAPAPVVPTVPPAPPPPVVHRPPSAPPVAIHAAPAPPPPRAPAPSSYPSAQKSKGRAPILDPWADEQTQPSLRVDAVMHRVQVAGDEVMVQMRRNAPRVIEEDDGVITSAAPLDTTLNRTARAPTPPARKWTATGEQPPGHIAEASAGVVPKIVPVGKPRAPAPPGPPPQPPVAGPPSTSALSTPAPITPAPITPAPMSAPAVTAPATPAAMSTVPSFHLAPPAPGPASPAPLMMGSQPVSAVTAPLSAAPLGAGPQTPRHVAPPSTAAPSSLPFAATLPQSALAAAAMLPPAAPPAATPSAPTTFDPLNAPTMPSVPSAIPRPRPVTVPPPAPSGAPAGPPVASLRLPAPPASLRVPPPSRPPPASTASPSVAPIAAPPSAPTLSRPAPRPSSPMAAPMSTRASSPPSVPVPSARASSARPSSPMPAPIPPAPPPVSAPPAPAPPAPFALDLEGVDAFADLPTETRAHLASLARIEVLGADEEVSAFGAALLVEGAAAVCATIVDEPVSRAVLGALLPTRGTFAGTVALRVVAGAAGARVAVWDQPVIDEALRSCPWVLEELVGRADRLQALAGATMGPFGELDEPTRDRVLERLTVRVAQAREAISTDGAAAALVCVGSVELGAVVVRAGEVLFPRSEPNGAHAGAQGAILLVGDAAFAADLAAGPASLASLFAAR